MSFFAFCATVFIVAFLLACLFLLCFGMMHGHLQSKNEAFGSAPNKTDFQRLEDKVDAILRSNH